MENPNPNPNSQPVLALSRTVAVVHVEIEHRDPGQPVRALRVARGGGRGGEQAEAHAGVGQAVMAGRARQRIGIAQFTPHDRINRLRREPRGNTRNIIATRSDGRLEAQVTAVLGAQFREAVEIGGGVDAQKVLTRQHRRGAHVQHAGEARDVHQALQPALAVRALAESGGIGRLHPAAHGEEQRKGLAEMPKALLVMEKTGAALRHQQSLFAR
jgi:hypothetical protein